MPNRPAAPPTSSRPSTRPCRVSAMMAPCGFKVLDCFIGRFDAIMPGDRASVVAGKLLKRRKTTRVKTSQNKSTKYRASQRPVTSRRSKLWPQACASEVELAGDCDGGALDDHHDQRLVQDADVAVGRGAQPWVQPHAKRLLELARNADVGHGRAHNAVELVLDLLGHVVAEELQGVDGVVLLQRVCDHAGRRLVDLVVRDLQRVQCRIHRQRTRNRQRPRLLDPVVRQVELAEGVVDADGVG
mmetsp:Transcript_35339/g.70693  ORF Transcript_35339/g.70693 Transcript_35339/m.70693 type:complete len:243 (-) Transcript_35339:220-948(-)